MSAFIYVPNWSAVSLYNGGPLIARGFYPLFHASLLHALLNTWCFLSIVFIYKVSCGNIAMAYIIAMFAPPCAIYDTPTVGFSVVCFALLGMLLFKVRHRVYYLLCLAPYIALGFLIPYVNGAIHLYAFIAGAFVGLLNAPIVCKKK